MGVFPPQVEHLQGPGQPDCVHQEPPGVLPRYGSHDDFVWTSRPGRLGTAYGENFTRRSPKSPAPTKVILNYHQRKRRIAKLTGDFVTIVTAQITLLPFARNPNVGLLSQSQKMRKSLSLNNSRRCWYCYARFCTSRHQILMIVRCSSSKYPP